MGGLTIALAVAVLGMAALMYLRRRRVREMTERVEEFLTLGRQPLSYSVREDDLAPLHNAVAELENKLLLAREQLTEETRRVSDLTADISHQLKTPLSALRLFCELDGGEHLEAQLSQIERMERLIQSLLRLERLCADGYDFSFAEHDLGAMIEQVWAALREVYPGREMTLTGSAALRCDEKWMSEAFMNLLKNACEHTRPDCRVTVTLEETESAVFCTVEDDGGGVAEKDLRRLFERFYRAEGASQEGTGIGLAMVKAIIRRHHGDISAENTDRGLRMRITLPKHALNRTA